MRVLILYASTDGQTERIAARMQAVLAGQGHAVTRLAAGDPRLAQALESRDAVIVGGGIRYGHHPRALEIAVQQYRGSIAAVPNAFFSVSLSAGGPGARLATASGYVEEFARRTGWQPQRTACFAGALRYRQYSAFIRFLMRLIVGAAGGDTDTSRDYEYTDWVAVERFASELAAQLQPATIT
jgi:menaquinone-dependent protoporphyrinogen oxidase